jgi:hypothetical protein
MWMLLHLHFLKDHPVWCEERIRKENDVAETLRRPIFNLNIQDHHIQISQYWGKREQRGFSGI